jgi:hypothetical protein
MTELYYIYQRSVGEKDDFLRRIIPLRSNDAKFGTPRERVAYAKYWEAEYLNLKADLDYMSVEDFGLYKAMKDWHNRIGDMLAYVSDVLVPHGFDEIVKDDFASLRQLLQLSYRPDFRAAPPDEWARPVDRWPLPIGSGDDPLGDRGCFGDRGCSLGS